MSNSVYESIMTGLNEALADAQSERSMLKRYKVNIETNEIVEVEKESLNIKGE